jgi:Xaa-Pro dipeptidase
MIKADVKGTEVHKAVSDFIDSTEFKGRFIHGTGHQIGLSVHDGAALTKTVEVDLKENMVCTVEPGIYFPGYGGVRIEDDVLVKKDGIEILTSARKDLIEI